MYAVPSGSLGCPLSSTDLLQVQGTAGYAERGIATGRRTILKAVLRISGISLTSLFCFILFTPSI